MPTYAPRETFDRELRQLQEDVLQLGSMVEQAVLNSVEALVKGDQNVALLVCENDHLINEKRYAIEGDCLTLIATQQPMAKDLRIVAAVLEIITELERIGDYAKGIGRITLRLGDNSISGPMAGLHRMADLAVNMLRRALTAFIQRDAETALKIPQEDNEIDMLYNRLYRELIAYEIAHPEAVDQANFMIWAAHNLERAADRVTNICERIVFVVTGQMKELDVTDDELSPKE